MIAIGGAIGTGLFLGAGGRLASAGPALAIVFLICGVFAFFILRALGELVLHRPSSGSFISYAREFYGEKFAYAAGWMYFLNWATTAIVDVTAVALYMHYWSAFTAAPQWLLALIALAIVLALNLVAVKVFGEMEFWFALVKVAALVVFLIVGIVWLAWSFPVTVGGAEVQTGWTVLQQNGGVFPQGLVPVVLVVQGVVFAYAAIELVGTASGETQDVEKVIPAPSTPSSSASRSSTSAPSCCSRSCSPTRRTAPTRARSSPSSPASDRPRWVPSPVPS
ncbi:D-serine/D-alanine/glycine transporter [Clavibacter michiganensis subsp. michiganensis]|uniref:D-serine/D-alanine/glycine transporter n=1 Tax=Clavibacter michiganensis subsp. michiganensis TaxID=33013 RepID=A0A251XCK4_CLAMM|nr:D-serine/D-alanine/glycine transporter [Clavibacter michiganensis subsp. michiganensis]OUD99908.1 D-serine/D-alanine/glycine transporter [Clavibacter michiganensis subsp. michiganensis]